MRNPEDKKTERRTVLMTKKLSEDIDNEAKKRGIKPNAVMNERLEHAHGEDNKPPKMAEFQDFANEAVKRMQQYSEQDAKYLEREANKLWTF